MILHNTGMIVLKLGGLFSRFLLLPKNLKSALAHKTALNTFLREQKNFTNLKTVQGPLRSKRHFLNSKR